MPHSATATVAGTGTGTETGTTQSSFLRTPLSPPSSATQASFPHSLDTATTYYAERTTLCSSESGSLTSPLAPHFGRQGSLGTNGTSGTSGTSGTAPTTASLAEQSLLDTSDEEAECPICFEPLSLRLQGEKPHLVPTCNHPIHHECFVTL